MGELIVIDGKQRDTTIDIVKALGIFCMVAGHSGWPFTHFIYLFHMAIFFIASGYCYKGKNAESVKSTANFVKRKFMTLWFPYVLWTAIYTLLHNFFLKINVYTDNPQIYDLVSGKFISTTAPWSHAQMKSNIIQALFLQGGTQLGGAFWFLATLMEISVGYCLIDFFLRLMLRKNEKLVFAAQWVVAILFLVYGYHCSKTGRTIYNLDKVFSFYILFHGGYTLKKFGWSSKERKNTLHVGILAVAFAILCICNRFGTIELGANLYVNPLYLLLVSFVGWQFLYEIAFFLSKIAQLKPVLVCMGQNTLAVVILHFLCFKIVSLIGVLTQHQSLFLIAAFPVLYTSGIWWVAYTLVGLAVPIGLSLLWKRAKKAFKFF